MSLFQRLAKVQGKENGQENLAPKQQQLLSGFPGGREVKEPLGSYYLIERQYSEKFLWPSTSEDNLTTYLQLLRGIGPVTEMDLKQEGYHTLHELCTHPRWGEEAAQVLTAIDNRHMRLLGQFGMKDCHLLSFFQPEDVVCLDIESTGLWASQPLFLIGILYQGEKGLELKQFLARNFAEEKPLLAALIKELSRFSLVVTYNGKRFDIPYIEGRTVEHRIFHRFDQSHIDLLHHARRHYKCQLPNCRLVTLEENLFNQYREGDVPGFLIPQLYHRFTKTQEPGLIKDILEHNALDLLALSKLLPLVRTSLYPHLQTNISMKCN